MNVLLLILLLISGAFAKMDDGIDLNECDRDGRWLACHEGRVTTFLHGGKAVLVVEDSMVTWVTIGARVKYLHGKVQWARYRWADIENLKGQMTLVVDRRGRILKLELK